MMRALVPDREDKGLAGRDYHMRRRGERRKVGQWRCSFDGLGETGRATTMCRCRASDLKLEFGSKDCDTYNMRGGTCYKTLQSIPPLACGRLETVENEFLDDDIRLCSCFQASYVATLD